MIAKGVLTIPIWRITPGYVEVGLRPTGTTILAWDGSECLPHRSSPLPHRSSPLPRRSSPLPHRSSPLPRRSSPLPHRSSPLPRRSSPLPRRSSPLAHRIAPRSRKPESEYSLQWPISLCVPASAFGLAVNEGARPAAWPLSVFNRCLAAGRRRTIRRPDRISGERRSRRAFGRVPGGGCPVGS